MNSASVVFLGIGIILLIIIEILLIMVLVKMAKKRGRSRFGWGFLGFIGTLSGVLYFLFIIILACLGETDDKRRERIMEEESWRS